MSALYSLPVILSRLRIFFCYYAKVFQDWVSRLISPAMVDLLDKREVWCNNFCLATIKVLSMIEFIETGRSDPNWKGSVIREVGSSNDISFFAGESFTALRDREGAPPRRSFQPDFCRRCDYVSAR